MKDELFPLIYVASSDESGSALAERLLGAHPAIWSLGELKNLPRARRTQAPCSCGAQLSGCLFWSRAFRDLDPRLEVAVEALSTRRATLPRRMGEISDLLLGASSPRRIEEAQTHGAQSRAVLESFRETAGRLQSTPIHWMLDASRDARRLLRLKDSRRFDLRVLHVVRDPRADVHAHLRASGAMTRRAVLRHASRWAMENLLLARLVSGGFRQEHTLRVRHEDLTRDPEEALKSVGAWLGLSFPSWTRRLVTQPRTHSLVLNGERLLDEALAPTETWREELPTKLADTAWRVTWPVRAALGYGQP